VHYRAQKQKNVIYGLFGAKRSLKLCFVARPLSSHALAQRAGTAVTRSSSCLYKVAVQDDGVVEVRTLKNEVYAVIRFEYGFCNGKDRAALVDYRRVNSHHRIPHLKNSEPYTHLSEIRFLPANNAASEQRRVAGDVLAGVQRSPSTCTCSIFRRLL